MMASICTTGPCAKTPVFNTPPKYQRIKPTNTRLCMCEREWVWSQQQHPAGRRVRG